MSTTTDTYSMDSSLAEKLETAAEILRKGEPVADVFNEVSETQITLTAAEVAIETMTNVARLLRDRAESSHRNDLSEGDMIP